MSECQHQWEPAPYPPGIVLLAGTFDDMAEEERQVCCQCSEVRWVVVGEPFALSLSDDEGK